MNLVNEGVLPPNEPDDRDERMEEREMAQEHETVADIVAEMKRTKYGADDCSVRWCLREWADRIEAAWKRERDELVYAYDPTKAGKGRLPDGSAYALEAMREPEMDSHAVGNASAMREAQAFSRAYIRASERIVQ